MDQAKDIQEEASSGFNLDMGLLIMLTVKSLVWSALIFGLAIVTAYTYLYYTQPIYEANSVIQLINDNQANRVLNVENIYEEDNLSKDLEVLRSPEFLKLVVQSLDHDISYFSEGEVLTNEKYLNSAYTIFYEVVDPIVYNRKIYFSLESESAGKLSLYLNGQPKSFDFNIGDTVDIDIAKIVVTARNESKSLDLSAFATDDKHYFTINSTSRQVQELAFQYQVVILNASANTIRINVKNANPTKASALCAAVAETYIIYDQERQAESANSVIEFIDDQIDEVFVNLKSSEDLISEFKQESRLEQKQEIAGSYINRMSTLEKQQAEIRIQIELLEELTFGINNENTDLDIYGLIPMLTGTEFETSVRNQIEELERLVMLRNRRLGSATKSNPTMVIYEEQIELQKNLILKSIDVLHERLISQSNSIEQKIREIENNFMDLPTREIEYARLERVFNSHEKYYTLLLEKKTEFRISKAGLVPDNRILKRAQTPVLPISPSKQSAYLSAIIFGILMTILLIAVRYILNNDISVDHLKQALLPEISVLGIVPKSHEVIPQSQLVIDKKPKSIMAESFRSIRTNLEFFESKVDKKVIAVTSTISGEGKTFVAINLAGILAYSGKRVIILDLDMRRPRIHSGFQSDNNFGMSTLLSGRGALKDMIRNSDMEGLDFITAGPIPPNPSELIINGRLTAAINELKENYDVVMIDNPPVGLVADGITTLRMADFPLYIFRSEYSKKAFTAHVNKIFRENKIKNLAVVLNAVDLDNLKYKRYGAYGNKYGYGYGYGYGHNGYYEEDSKSSKKSFLSGLKSKGGNS